MPACRTEQVYKLAAAVVQAAGWAAGRQIAPTAIQAARLELYGHPSGSIPSAADAGGLLHAIILMDLMARPRVPPPSPPGGGPQQHKLCADCTCTLFRAWPSKQPERKLNSSWSGTTMSACDAGSCSVLHIKQFRQEEEDRGRGPQQKGRTAGLVDCNPYLFFGGHSSVCIFQTL